MVVAGLTLTLGWLSWRLQHSGDAPRPAAGVRYEFAEMADVPVDGAGHFVPVVTDGLAVRRPPVAAAMLLGEVRAVVGGEGVQVSLHPAEGALCAAAASGDAACAGGAARAGRCPEGADCVAGDSILAAAADVVVTDWSIENPLFERVPWRVRIWRIAVDGPRPLIELDLPSRPAEVWVAPGGDVVELVVVGDGGGPWRIVRCVIGGSCARSGPFTAHPTIRSAVAVTLDGPGGSSSKWPDGVMVELDACQVLWPPVVEVRGRLNTLSPTAAPIDAGLIQITIVRADGEGPTVIPRSVSTSTWHDHHTCPRTAAAVGAGGEAEL